METKNTPEVNEVTKKKVNVLAEVASGFLLGATIMSFLSLWTVGMVGLATTPLV